MSAADRSACPSYRFEAVQYARVRLECRALADELAESRSERAGQVVCHRSKEAIRDVRDAHRGCLPRIAIARFVRFATGFIVDAPVFAAAAKKNFSIRNGRGVLTSQVPKWRALRQCLR